MKHPDGTADVYRLVEPDLYELWVVVRPSIALKALGLHGELGVFAAHRMPEGTTIGRYVGRVLGKEKSRLVEEETAALEATDQSDYLLITLHGLIVDGARPPQSDAEQLACAGQVLFSNADWTYPGAFVHLFNDNKDTGLPENVTVDADGFAVTLDNIPAYRANASDEVNVESELLWPYGNDYWAMISRRQARERRKRSNAERNQRAAKRQKRSA